MAITFANITSGGDTDNNSTATTASVTPSANKLQLLTVISKTNITADPNQPTVTGNGLTWVAINSIIYDTTGSTRRRITVFRAMGASPSSGTISIDFGGQNQLNVIWILDEVTGMDTSGTNGSGAVVQSGTTKDESGTQTSMSITLSAFDSASNVPFGAAATDTTTTFTAGTGFSIIKQLQSSTDLAGASESGTANDNVVDITLSGAGGSGFVAIEIRAAGTITVTNVTSGTDVDGNSSSTTSSVTPSANKLQLLTVVSRTGITADPNQPTATGNSLTWVAINSVVYDTSGSTRRRVTLLRAMGASPASGAITIDFGGQNQTDVIWSLEEVTGMDTSGTNGSGAIVQSTANKQEATTGAGTFSLTLSAFSNVNNATFGGFGQDSNDANSAGSGFTQLLALSATNSLRLLTESKPINDTGVDFSYPSTASAQGGVAIEISIPLSATSVKDLIMSGIIAFAR